MSETNEIVAKVTEPKRQPRPTMHGSIFCNMNGLWIATTTLQCDTDPAFRGRFTVLGELESARLARIEQARDAVIRAAKELSAEVRENKHVRPDAVDKMAMALEALATQENAK